MVSSGSARGPSRSGGGGRRQTPSGESASCKPRSTRRVRKLERDVDQTWHFYAGARAELRDDLLADLERSPPDLEAALVRVRKQLVV